MSEPTTDPAPADPQVQGSTTATVDAAIRASAAKPQPPATPTDPDPAPAKDGDAWDETRAMDKIRKANSEAENLRKRIKELEPLADLGKQLQAASQSDMERLETRAAGAEQERDALRVQLARATAAARYGLPADLVDLLGAGTDEEIAARAELLAAKIAATAPPAAPAAPATQQRPVEALRPAAAPGTSSSSETPDAWIRRLAGRR